VLKKAGYLVVEAASAEAALMVAQTTPLDILLTDVIMPDVSGPQLAERMAALRPEAQVLFMSGYAPESSGVNLDPKHFLPKPFTPDALLARIAGLIEARTPHPARPPLVIYEGAA
jgi:two-component system cell cycle sensor histidine kinase/response regulator CckA